MNLIPILLTIIFLLSIIVCWVLISLMGSRIHKEVRVFPIKQKNYFNNIIAGLVSGGVIVTLDKIGIPVFMSLEALQPQLSINFFVQLIGFLMPFTFVLSIIFLIIVSIIFWGLKNSIE